MDTRTESATEWHQVWAAYDERQPVQSPPPPRPSYPVQASSRARTAPSTSRARRSWLAFAILPMLGLGWMSAPYTTAWNLVQALDGRDATAMARHMDLPALQAAMRDSLLPQAAAQAATPEARAYLTGMAEDIAAAWGSPTALTEVARARGVPAGAATAALSRTVPTGLTSFDMPLHGGVAPITLQLELTSNGMTPGWQVTGVKLEDRQPVSQPSPMRFIAQR